METEQMQERTPETRQPLPEAAMQEGEESPVSDEQFEQNFNSLCKMIRSRLDSKYDVVIAFTGGEGTGKSTLQYKMGCKIDPKFTMEERMLFRPNDDQLKDLVINLPIKSFIAVDEAIRIVYKLKWSSKSQIDLNEFFGQCRKEQKAIGLCMPRFWDFSEYFRNWRVTIWIHVFARGYAVVAMKDDNHYTRDPWHMDANDKVLASIMETTKLNRIPIEKSSKYYGKLHGFMMVIKYPNWSPEEESKYNAFIEANKYKKAEIREELKPEWKLKMEKLQYKYDVLMADREELKPFMALKDKADANKRLAAKLGTSVGTLKENASNAASRAMNSRKTPLNGVNIPKSPTFGEK